MVAILLEYRTKANDWVWVLFTAWLRSICKIGVIIFKKGHLVQFSIGNFGYSKHSNKAFLFFFPRRHISIFLVEQVSLLFLGGTSFQSFHGLHVEVRDFKLFFLTTNINWNASTSDMIFMQTETQFGSHCSVSSLVIFLFQVSTV